MQVSLNQYRWEIIAYFYSNWEGFWLFCL